MNLLFIPNELESQGWLITTFPGYTNEYKVFQNNWKVLCDNIKVTPKDIIIVKEIPIDKTKPCFELMNSTLDRLTREGYCCRREGELVGCKGCGKAMLSKDLHEKLMRSDRPIKDVVPDFWSSRCNSCFLSKNF